MRDLWEDIRKINFPPQRTLCHFAKRQRGHLETSSFPNFRWEHGGFSKTPRKLKAKGLKGGHVGGSSFGRLDPQNGRGFPFDFPLNHQNRGTSTLKKRHTHIWNEAQIQRRCSTIRNEKLCTAAPIHGQKQHGQSARPTTRLPHFCIPAVNGAPPQGVSPRTISEGCCASGSDAGRNKRSRHQAALIPLVKTTALLR